MNDKIVTWICHRLKMLKQNQRQQHDRIRDLEERIGILEKELWWKEEE